jgi:uncharacterized membrane protein
MSYRLDPARSGSIALAALVGALTLAGLHLDIRPLLAAAFLLWVPGMAAVGYLRLDDHLLAAVLSISVSIAVGTLGAELMVWTHLWHPRAAVVVLALACIVALIGQMELASTAAMGDGEGAENDPDRQR